LRTRPGLTDYLSRHYCPDDGSESIDGPTATTLEYAIADSAIGRFAAMQGDQPRAAEFAARAAYWRNVFDPTATSGAFVGYMQPRLAMDANGAPAFRATDVSSGHSVVEGSLAQYTFLVPQDVPGLIAALGGDAPFIARLDDHLAQVNTGTHGPHFYIGNEPGFATPWEYPFAGAPWKTQEAVTRIVRTAFSIAPSGLPGNEDLGAMSSWLVWAMLGLYPEVPGVPGLVVGSPVFPQVDLQVAGRQHFRITAREVSPAAIYIQDATLNGSALPGPWLPLSQMRDGGVLALTMGAGANTAWGAAAASRPQALMK
jgi:predicted alpha-1,2-mannosidase